MRPVITLLTDFGSADHYVAAMKGVILTICPEAEIVDISHEIAPFSIPEAAYTLAQAWKYLPSGTVHVAVVDPGVGSSRRAIAAEVTGHRFLAPDNGLLSMILAGAPQAKVREISTKRYFLQPVSDTFHGRDVFAPVAARLAGGLPVAKLGRLVDDVQRGEFARPASGESGRWHGTVLKIDRFGNIISNLDWSSFAWIAQAPFRLRLGRRTVTHFCRTYADAPTGRFFALKGSSGYVEVSLNQSNAAIAAGVVSGSPLSLTVTLG